MTKARIVLIAIALAVSTASLLAQDQLTPTAADEIAAAQATSPNMIGSRALTDVGRRSHAADLTIASNRADRDGDHDGGPALFPADLSKFSPTAKTLQTTTLHNIFINQPASAWGDPVRFQNDLNHSELIHITDQYVGVDFDGRYPLGKSFTAKVTPAAGFPGSTTNNIITINQVITLLHAAGSIVGTGHDHVFNVFIPPGTDTCFPGNVACFSPDSPNNFFFCAFHSFVTFSDIGQVLFTVLPETGVPGCSSLQPSPNGIVADSVDSTMSHELFETITDPDLDAFLALSSLDLFGFEIGDVCQPAGNSQGQFLVPTFRVHEHLYAIQLEYSNRGHGCFSRPVDDD